MFKYSHKVQPPIETDVLNIPMFTPRIPNITDKIRYDAITITIPKTACVRVALAAENFSLSSPAVIIFIPEITIITKNNNPAIVNKTFTTVDAIPLKLQLAVATGTEKLQIVPEPPDPPKEEHVFANVLDLKIKDSNTIKTKIEIKIEKYLIDFFIKDL